MKRIIYGENKNLISKTLREYRIKSGLSQERLAAKLQTMNLNIDQQMISRIESNKRIVTDYELACICYVLGVEIKAMIESFYENIQ